MSRLPSLAVVLIALATAILWLLVLAAILVEFVGGQLIRDLGSMIGPTGLLQNAPIRIALMIEWSVLAAQLAMVLLLGTVILWRQWSVSRMGAVRAAIWLIRVLIAFELIHLFTELSTMFASGGNLAVAMPSLMMNLPMALVTIAFLLCANRYLCSRPDSAVFE